jgi:hypothetical protein
VQGSVVQRGATEKTADARASVPVAARGRRLSDPRTITTTGTLVLAVVEAGRVVVGPGAGAGAVVGGAIVVGAGDPPPDGGRVVVGAGAGVGWVVGVDPPPPDGGRVVVGAGSCSGARTVSAWSRVSSTVRPVAASKLTVIG